MLRKGSFFSSMKQINDCLTKGMSQQKSQAADLMMMMKSVRSLPFVPFFFSEG